MAHSFPDMRPASLKSANERVTPAQLGFVRYENGTMWQPADDLKLVTKILKNLHMFRYKKTSIDGDTEVWSKPASDFVVKAKTLGLKTTLRVAYKHNIKERMK